MSTVKKIFTIGHSNRSIEELIQLLQVFGIGMLVDVRSFPGSQKWPQFNRQSLSTSLQQSHISYIHMPLLGGKNTMQGGYTAYMQTDVFRKAVTELENVAVQRQAVYMCAEANWRNCHRSHISNYLKQNSWQVIHIKAAILSEEHSFTLKQGKLF